jgi:hypothetical protein
MEPQCSLFNSLSLEISIEIMNKKELFSRYKRLEMQILQSCLLVAKGYGISTSNCIMVPCLKYNL